MTSSLREHDIGRSSARPSAGRCRVPGWLALAPLVLALTIAGCGGGSGGGGSGGASAGSGLRGTVPDNRRLASQQLEIRAASGERSVATIESDGRFAVEQLTGTGPWMLRATFGVDESWYAITHSADKVANVHAYSDLAVRNVLASAGQSVEALFDQEGALAADMLPTEPEVTAVNTAVGDFLAPSLEAYGLAGLQLATAEFAANGQGLDAFLTANPALVENDAFTILGTDPVTDTRTTIAEDVSIAKDLVAADGTAPGAPSGLRALPAAADEIVLVWDGAQDDTAVVNYEISRDDAVIATTPYPVFLDSPLQAGVSYDYAVLAIDAAGNRSILTPTISSEPLAAPDEEAPAVPTGLEVTIANASARLRWTQAGVGDVASFLVYRSEDGGMIQQRARVTSTATTDLDLAVATPYCYSVSALDASENESAIGEQVCARTTGSANVAAPIVTPTMSGTPSAPVDQGPLDARLAALLAVDVTNTACNLELDVSSVEGPLVLDRPCYRVPDGLIVRENGQLTIAAGTVLKFGSTEGLEVLTGGSLTARGTAAAPIVFSGIDPTPGFWSGVEFSRSNSTRNVLENVVIEYAGSSVDGALEVLSFTSSITRLAVDGAVLRRSAGHGFRVGADAFRGALSNIVSTENAIAGLVGPEVAALLGSGGRYTGNADDVIEIAESENIDAATVWPSTGVPWRMDRLTVNAPLEMAAGTTVQFRSEGGLSIESTGSLRAIGTASAPILFTGVDNTPGFWDGVRFSFSNSTNNRLEHVTVEYAGGAGNLDGGIVSRTFSSSQGRLGLSDVTSRFNEGPGVRLEFGTQLTAFERVTSTSNGLAAIVHPDVLPSFGDGLSLGGNTDDVVSLYDVDIDSAVTWPALGVPYLFSNIDIDITGALVLSPGTTMLATTDGNIDVDRTGSFTAVGTAAAPIRIVGRSAVPGHWQGIDFAFSNSPRNRLEHVELRHGGGGADTATRGNITQRCFTSSRGRVAIADSVIADSLGWGVYRAPDSGCTVEVGARVTFPNNALGTVSPM